MVGSTQTRSLVGVGGATSNSPISQVEMSAQTRSRTPSHCTSSYWLESHKLRHSSHCESVVPKQGLLINWLMAHCEHDVQPSLPKNMPNPQVPVVVDWGVVLCDALEVELVEDTDELVTELD